MPDAPAPAAPKPSVPPSAPRPAQAPFWMPSGGRGALYFWGGLCILLAVGVVWFYEQAAREEKSNRQLNDQARLLQSERDKLRSQIDMLQTEVSQQTLQIKGSEETLREAKQAILAAQAQTDQQGQQAETIRRGETDLQAALVKALPSQDGLAIVPGTAGDGVLTVRLATVLLFDTGDTAPNAKGTDLLKKIGAVLKAAPNVQSIEVGGYSDPEPPMPAGAKANVWDLSARRAANAVRILDDAGIADPLLTAQGYGATHPLVPNDGPDKAKNRRVEITVRIGTATAAGN